jgi:metal-responsive CopG/Arc/MetJ family transcriptional regulator
MGVIRLNISLPKDTFAELSREVESRKRSQFITAAIKSLLKEKKAQKLAAEYKEASEDIRRINQELDGVISDGLD